MPPTQVRPVQQSPVSVQVAPCGWHAAGFPHIPDEQIAEQHWVPASHGDVLGKHIEPPSGLVNGVWHAKRSSPDGAHSVPGQHRLPPSTGAQIAPTGKQDCAVHVSTPASLGTHGRKLQHSPAELQVSPGDRQQPGTSGLMLGQPASQVGELGGH